jgi:hypothetical protein
MIELNIMSTKHERTGGKYKRLFVSPERARNLGYTVVGGGVAPVSRFPRDGTYHYSDVIEGTVDKEASERDKAVADIASVQQTMDGICKAVRGGNIDFAKIPIETLEEIKIAIEDINDACTYLLGSETEGIEAVLAEEVEPAPSPSDSTDSPQIPKGSTAAK